MKVCTMWLGGKHSTAETFIYLLYILGKGTQVWKKSGAIYDGEWKFGKRDGYGTYSVLLPGSKKYVKKYCGGWTDGRKHVCI